MRRTSPVLVVLVLVAVEYSGLPAFFTPCLVLASRVLYGLDIDSVVPVDVVRAHP